MTIQHLTMFGLALLSVSMWTFRIAIATRGLKWVCAVIAAAEAVVFVLIFSHLLTDLASPGKIASYAGGVAAGTALGLLVDDKTKRGHSELHLVAFGDRADLVERFRAQGWPATSTLAAGPDGPVTAMWLTVPDTELRAVTAEAEQWAPDAFWTLRRLDKATLSPAAPTPVLG